MKTLGHITSCSFQRVAWKFPSHQRAQSLQRCPQAGFQACWTGRSLLRSAELPSVRPPGPRPRSTHRSCCPRRVCRIPIVRFDSLGQCMQRNINLKYSNYFHQCHSQNLLCWSLIEDQAMEKPSNGHALYNSLRMLWLHSFFFKFESVQV